MQEAPSSAEQVHFVPMRGDHVESFHRALDTVARERKYLLFLEAPALEDTRAFVLGSLAGGNPHFVAEAGSEVVGWCDIRRRPLSSVAHRGDLGLGVLPGYRGQGLGRRLLSATVRKAIELGVARIEFEVRADNARALALYERFGFAREGIVRDAVIVDGQSVDAVAMAMLTRQR